MWSVWSVFVSCRSRRTQMISFMICSMGVMLQIFVPMCFERSWMVKPPKPNLHHESRYLKHWNLILLSILLSRILHCFSRHLVHTQVDFSSSLGPDPLVLWRCSATFWTASSCGARGCCAMSGGHLLFQSTCCWWLRLVKSLFRTVKVLISQAQSAWLHRTFLGTYTSNLTIHWFLV